MDPAQNDRQPRPAPASLKDGARPAHEDPSVHSNVTPFPAPAAAAEAAGHAHHLPVWMARSMMIVFVAFCIEIGLVMITAPWVPHLWDENGLVMAYPQLRAFLAHNFVRGAVTGMGILDIWYGIYEAVHYHDPKP
jgi:hypothetical protein